MATEHGRSTANVTRILFIRELDLSEWGNEAPDWVYDRDTGELCAHMTLYNLTMCDNELGERFNIGFFSSQEKAEETAQYYLRNIRGFCEYDCGYTITEKAVVGGGNSCSVYVVYCWNGDEEDIIESECFTAKVSARRQLSEMKMQYDREEWCVDCFCTDECKWQDGFVRV